MSGIDLLLVAELIAALKRSFGKLMLSQVFVCQREGVWLGDACQGGGGGGRVGGGGGGHLWQVN